MRIVQRWLLVLTLALPASADLIPPVLQPAQDRSPRATAPDAFVPSGLRVGFLDPAPPAPPPAAGPAPCVPATPGSAALALWAVGGLGLWQLSRCTRKLDFSRLPDWYHDGGPRQIGTATALEVDWAGMPQFTPRSPERLPAIDRIYVPACPHHPRGRPVLPLAARAPPCAAHTPVPLRSAASCASQRFICGVCNNHVAQLYPTLSGVRRVRPACGSTCGGD